MNRFVLQALLDSKQKEWQAQRQKSGMSLGSFIAALEKLSPKAWVSLDFCSLRPTDFGSYRGYYSDLALGFEADSGGVTAEELLAKAKACLGKTFEGYKGGDFTMDEHTPLWLANYGDCGWRIVGVRVTTYTDSQYVAIEAKSDENKYE